MQSALGMQFIMDGSGNYYRTNDNDQLVVAANREEATIFTFFEANQRIGGGKKAYFYHTIPVEDNSTTQDMKLEENEIAVQEEVLPEDDMVPYEVIFEDESVAEETAFDDVTLQTPIVAIVKSNKINVEDNPKRYDIAHYDWLEYLQNFCYLASVVGKRHEELTKQLSEVDQKACDILHLIELYDLMDEEEVKAVSLLKDIRQRRRDIKDEMLCLEYFQASFGTSNNVSEAKTIIKQIKRLDKRVYRPRQLPELFKGMKDRKTDRKLYRENRNQRENISEHVEETHEGESIMEYARKETIYDTQINDWLAFAKEQLNFYQNIPQYIINLQAEINAIDYAIEEALSQIEDANYNVAQGYKAFKELKDLRNEKKEKQRELDCLKVITKDLDCSKMEEEYGGKVRVLEDILNTESAVLKE